MLVHHIEDLSTVVPSDETAFNCFTEHTCDETHDYYGLVFLYKDIDLYRKPLSSLTDNWSTGSVYDTIERVAEHGRSVWSAVGVDIFKNKYAPNQVESEWFVLGLPDDDIINKKLFYKNGVREYYKRYNWNEFINLIKKTTKFNDWSIR